MIDLHPKPKLITQVKIEKNQNTTKDTHASSNLHQHFQN